MKNFLFSVIICTNRDISYLDKCLRSLSRQTASPEVFEVIIVYNGEGTGTIDEIQKYIYKNKMSFPVIFFQEKHVGLSYARNLGYQKARGKYIAYLDDDAWPDRDWLKKIQEEAMKNSDHIMIGGPIVPVYENSKPVWFKDSWESDFKGVYPRYLKKGETLSASNMVIRRNMLVRYHGFSTILGMKGRQMGVAEETDLVERIEKDHVNVQYYLPEAKIYHSVAPHKMSIKYRLKRSYSAGKSLALRRKSDSLPQKFFLLLKMVIGLFAAPLLKIVISLNSSQKFKTWIVDTLNPGLYALGYLSSSLPFLFFSMAFFATALLWIIGVPLWQFPDEQSHFGQVAYLAITGRNPTGDSFNLTDEIYLSEYLLGTVRDNAGRNHFTFHPEFKIPYTNSFTGKYEEDIIKLSGRPESKLFIKKEASMYPPSYYYPAAFLYRILEEGDLFTRIFAVRLWSLSLYLGTVFVIYKIGRFIFSDKSYSYILAILVGFHPMFSFANLGVNSDSLGNLLFGLFTYLSLKVLYSKVEIWSWVSLFAVTFLCIWTKPQFVISVPILLFIIFVHILKSFRKNKWVLLFFLCSVLGAVYLFFKADVSGFTTFRSFQRQMDLPSLVKFSKEYTLSHAYSEVMPWYWGIYKWLGVTYPRMIHRTINWIVLVCISGFTIWFVKSIVKREGEKRELKIILFLISVMSVFSIPIFIYDWLSWKTTGFVLGIQGRYFFPVILVHMVILLKGWVTVCSVLKKRKKIAVYLLPILMILLDYYGLYTMLISYYHAGFSLQFIYELSQYKPWFMKGFIFPILLVFSLFFTGVSLYRLLNSAWGDLQLHAK